MLKGILEGIILQIIDKKEIYGYEIVKKLNSMGFSQIVEGTVYTILLRSEKNGLLEINKRPSEIGPTRKFYSLSTKGKEELKIFWKKWNFLSEKIENLRNIKGE